MGVDARGIWNVSSQVRVRVKKRKEWAEVDERGVCESGEWGGVTQVAFFTWRPRDAATPPCPPAVKSVGSRLIPNSAAWRD